MGRTTNPEQGDTGYFEGNNDVFTRNEWKNEGNSRKKNLKSPTSSVKSTEVHDDGATRIRGYVPKLKFPKFNGTNPRMWIKKYNKYFHLCKIPEEQKVDLACLYMVEKAEQWVSS